MKYSAWNRSGRLVGLPNWQLAVLLVVAVSVGIAVAIVATGIFLIALPIAAVVILGYRLFGGTRRRSPRGVIEGEYEIVEPGRRERGSGRR